MSKDLRGALFVHYILSLRLVRLHIVCYYVINDYNFNSMSPATSSMLTTLVQALVSLQSELRILEQVRHPRIVQYHGCRSSDDGSLAIFMEYLPGVSRPTSCFRITYS